MSWEIVAAVIGVATVITGGVVKIFTYNISQKRLSEGSGPKRLKSSHSHNSMSIRDIERLARLEEQVKGQGRELGEVKSAHDKLSDKVTKLGDLVIEWIQTARPFTVTT